MLKAPARQDARHHQHVYAGGLIHPANLIPAARSTRDRHHSCRTQSTK
jgi:hypothetical protein